MSASLILNEELFSQVLLKPALEDGANQLLVVSGYATGKMAASLLESLAKRGKPVDLSLIVGMAARDGVLKLDHDAFVKLANTGTFTCRYLSSGYPVHSKLYCWVKDGTPVRACLGSANFTQNGFFGGQDELLAECEPESASEYYHSLLERTVDCLAVDVAEQVKITLYEPRSGGEFEPEIKEPLAPYTVPVASAGGIELSLLNTRTKHPHDKAGLNWGQRDGRDPDQAYIPVPVSIQNLKFFPPQGKVFNLVTDDGRSMLCKCAGDGGKNLESSENNSILGKYFRERLGLPSGEFVTLKHLEDYGRTSVVVSKLDDQDYFLDFSKP